MKQSAVFLDRDGTLIEDRGHLRTQEDVVFFPETFEALSLLKRSFLLFIVTHQPGISAGILSRDQVETVNAHLLMELRRRNISIEKVYYCPHQRVEQCACIKPNPFFLEQAAREYSLSLHDSYVVGDHPHDVELAERAGATGIYVLTGHGAKHRQELPGYPVVVPNILAAANWILKDQCRRTVANPLE